jgi:hypothetical protein
MTDDRREYQYVFRVTSIARGPRERPARRCDSGRAAPNGTLHAEYAAERGRYLEANGCSYNESC